jgi:alkylhydroperoxidase/carboxymuconolactone decarboxylase family protein YurZ/quercetin dioxygenase-like cupin family protein
MENTMRKTMIPIVGCLLLALTSLAQDKTDEKAQTLYAAGSQQSFVGPEKLFTGKVKVDLLFPQNKHTAFSGAYVTFAPGARTNWHLHPAGQHMIVTKGVALTGTRDGKTLKFKEGETVWCPPDIDHWHGATRHQAMTHLVITGSKDGQNVVWKEKVTDAQYNQPKQKEAIPMDETSALSKEQKSIIAIAAFTANGDLDRLKPALTAGLEAGLTVNEIKEVLVQMYAYAGFPRSLNGINAFMAIMKDREAKGIQDTVGKEATPLPADMDKDAYGAEVRAKLAGWETIPPAGGYQLFSPIIDTYLKEHLFADIFARDVLSHQQRELATIAALAAMDGTAGQLGFHIGAAMNTGWTADELKDFVSVLAITVGKAQAESAERVLSETLRQRE